MHTLMIFDDHKYVIDAICETIDFRSLDITFLGYAHNAREGLEKILSEKPDIVITDISMPGMTGLEMIEKSIEAGSKTKFILLSGYDNFEYARTALKYNIINYILKPVMPEDIHNALKKAVYMCDKESDNMNIKKLFLDSLPMLKENFIHNLLSGTNMKQSEFYEKADLFSFDIKDKMFRCITVNIDNYFDFQSRFTEEKRQYTKLDILTRIAKELHIDNTFVNFSDNQAHVLLYFPKKDSEKYSDSALISVLNEIIELISDCNDISLSFGVGNIAKNYTEIHESYLQSIEVFKYTFCQNPKSITFYNDIINTQVIQPVVNLYNRTDLIDSLKMHNISGLRNCFDDMLGILKTNKFINADYIRVIICEMYYTISSVLYNMGEIELCNMFKRIDYIKQIENAKSISTLENVFNSIIDTIEQTIDNKISQRTKRIIEQIIEYIETNYQYDISLETLSSHIFLTPNYLSRIFIAHTNTSFIKYLTAYRMEKAKELLLSGQYKVYDVCTMVGYKNPTYFRKLFKEYIGKNPSDFINE